MASVTLPAPSGPGPGLGLAMTTSLTASMTASMTASTASSAMEAEVLTELFHANADHYRLSFSAINRMRQHSQLCDVTLKIGPDAIHAHRLVLAAVSPYFNAMFNDDMVEKMRPEVTLHDVDGVALRQLIEYSYTGEILITEDNVQVLLPASSLLQMEPVREACCRFLLRQLHPSNCLGIRSFADAHACKELQTSSHQFAVQNFQEVMNTEEFLLLPYNDVEELVSSGQLNVSSEEKVFHAVLNWVKHDLAGREQHVAKLLKHVRLPLLERDFLMSHVECEPLVRTSEPCKELLLEAMKYHLLPDQRAALTTERTAARQPEGLEPFLFAVGGGSLFAIHSECEVFSARADRWQAIAPMLFRRSRAGVVGLNRQLYVVGGYDGTSDLSTAECYSPHLNSWSTITPMGTKRSCLGICALDGLLYVCGGYDGASCLNSMERFDPLTGVWTSCPAMLLRRRYCRLAVLDNCIYALGGFDSSNYQATVERLDPRAGRWDPVPSMPSRRSSCGVAALDGMLYCVGGNDGTMCMSSGERFNARRQAWEPIAAMHSRRSTHELVTMGGALYSLGGNDGSSSLNSVERYDVATNKWALVTAMLTRRSSVGAAVLDCLGVPSAS